MSKKVDALFSASGQEKQVLLGREELLLKLSVFLSVSSWLCGGSLIAVILALVVWMRCGQQVESVKAGKTKGEGVHLLLLMHRKSQRVLILAVVMMLLHSWLLSRAAYRQWWLDLLFSIVGSGG